MTIFPSSHALIHRREHTGDDQTDPFLLPWAGRPESASAAARRNATSTVPPYITASGRDLRLDVLRGLFVVVMVIDHVSGPSPVQWLTGGNRFFTSAAEGFILLSGVVAGLIYHRLVAREGFKSAVRKALGRAFTLYLLSVGLTLLMVPISEAFDLPWALGLDGTHPLTFVVGVLTLHRTYYLADVMLLYTLLFCLLPLPLFLMERGKTAWLLGASWLLWGLYQIVPASATILWPVAGNNLFAFSAWQVLFVSGLVLGYRRDRLPTLTYRGERRMQWVTGLLTLGLIGLYLLMQKPAAALPAVLRPLAADGATGLWLLQNIFAKTGVQPGRIVASAVVFGFLFLSLTRWWPVLGRRLEPVFAPLGQSALYAFTVHVALVVLAALISLPLGLSEKQPAWLNAFLQVAAVALIWILVRRQFLAPTPSSLRYWRRSPALMAVLVAILLPWLPLAPAQAQVPAAASVAGVPAAVLARARAYGTPIASLQRAAAAQTPAAPVSTPAMAGQSGPTMTSGGRSSNPPAATPAAPTAATSTPAGNQEVAPVSVAVADPVATAETPAPEVSAAVAEAAAPDDLAHGAARAVGSASFPAAPTPGSTGPAAQPAPAATPAPQKPAAAPAVSKPAAVAPAAAVAQAKPAAVAAPLKPAPAVAVSVDPLPPLPPDSQRLKSQYVGTLTGRAYVRTFHSDILNRDMTYWIYLPPDYGKTNRRYPVVYALHGGGGQVDEWAAYGLFDAADRAFAAGTLQPFIIVLPQGDKSYWTNWAAPGPRWGDYLAYDVVNQVDSSFGTIRAPASRAVGGLSMGAWGALYQGFTHPDIFGFVAASSPSLYPDYDNLQYLGTGAAFAAKDPLALARTAPGAASLRIWLDVGNADPWVSQMTALHDILSGRGIAHEWHLNDGPHAPEYWAQHVPDYLAFYARALAGQ